MVLKTKILSILIPVILFSGIGLFILAGLWNTGNKTPTRFEDNQLNSYDPQSISGSYSFADVSEFYEIPIEVLYEAFNIPNTFDPIDFKAKNLGSIYETLDVEIGTESVQTFVALYNNSIYEYSDAFLPKKAIELILKHNNSLSDEQISYLDTHSVNVVLLDTNSITLNEEDEEESTVFSIKGPTTIQEVLDAGLTKVEFEAIVGTSVIFTNETVKDFCIKNGLSFSEVKINLDNALLEK